MKNKYLEAVWQYLNGNYRTSEFALTNVCVAKCSFCGIWKQQPKVTVDRDKALSAIDKLADIGVRHITLTGGEAIIHPDIVDIVARCTRRGIISGIPLADPRLITEAKAAMLKKAGLDYLFISIDHHTDEVEFQARRIENILDHMKTAISILKKARIRVAASTLICNYNHTELEKLFEKCRELGFEMITVNYPEHSLSPVYELGGDMVNLTNEQVATALEEIIRLKNKGYRIVNPVYSMRNIIKYLRGEKVDCYCLGGNKVLFVDWFFDVYPCMHLDKSMGSVFDLDKSRLLTMKCNRCNMSWYRDFSVYLDGVRSVWPLVKAIRELYR
ncbi:MAG: radical SAM protein [Chloroflexota bacterium]